MKRVDRLGAAAVAVVIRLFLVLAAHLGVALARLNFLPAAPLIGLLEMALYGNVEHQYNQQKRQEHYDETHPPVLREEGHVDGVGTSHVRGGRGRCDDRGAGANCGAKGGQQRHERCGRLRRHDKTVTP